MEYITLPSLQVEWDFLTWMQNGKDTEGCLGTNNWCGFNLFARI
jgi:hypothetical protein